MGEGEVEEGAVSEEAVNGISTKHPHDEDPIIDAEGRCLICTRYVFDTERAQIIALCESVGIDALPDSLPSQWGHDTIRRVQVLIARLDAADATIASLTTERDEWKAEAATRDAVWKAAESEWERRTDAAEARASALLEAVQDCHCSCDGVCELRDLVAEMSQPPGTMSHDG